MHNAVVLQQSPARVRVRSGSFAAVASARPSPTGNEETVPVPAEQQTRGEECSRFHRRRGSGECPVEHARVTSAGEGKVVKMKQTGSAAERNAAPYNNNNGTINSNGEGNGTNKRTIIEEQTPMSGILHLHKLYHNNNVGMEINGTLNKLTMEQSPNNQQTVNVT